jgi:hypothetical protein
MVGEHAVVRLAPVLALALALAPSVIVHAYYHGNVNPPDKAPTVPTELPQLLAMEALFDSTLGFSWSTNLNWKSRDVTFYSDPCVNRWYGVICEQGNIVGINLSNNQYVLFPPVYPPRQYSAACQPSMLVTDIVSAWCAWGCAG